MIISKQRKTWWLMISIGVVLTLGLLAIGYWYYHYSQSPSDEEGVVVTDFISCEQANGIIQESYPRICVYESRSYQENIEPFKEEEPNMDLPPNEKQAILDWIAENNFNEYGDPQDTIYTGGSPLFDETSSTYQPLYEYLVLNHPDKPWLSQDVSEVPQGEAEDGVIPFTEVKSWKTFTDPNFTLEYPSFAMIASENGYPVKIYTEDEFEVSLTVSASKPNLETTCIKALALESDLSVYLCHNDNKKYSQIYQRMNDSVNVR